MRVAVVCGGPSREAEVSRSSGEEVAKALRETFEPVEKFELTPDVGQLLRTSQPDVVFPVLHGPPGEDGSFQGLLEVLGLPYVGSGVLASAAAMDKPTAKALFRAADLPVADDVVIQRDTGVEAACDTITARLGESVVVKPVGDGSAVGVRFASGAAELHDVITTAFEDDETLLVERTVAGREITVGLVGRDSGLQAFPVIEIVTPPGTWYDYEHRYTPGLSEHLIPAPIPDETATRLQELTRAAHRALGCRDLSRADFVLPPDGDPVLLEVNTLPGMTPTSLYPDGAAAAGITFAELVAHLVHRAAERGPRAAAG